MGIIKMAGLVIFHPIVAFQYIKKQRDRFNYVSIIILFFLIIAVRIFEIYFTHFPLSDIQSKDANIFLEIVKLFLPVLIWVIASYAITSILEGECQFREILMATAYSMVPYIIITVFLTLLSNILEAGQAGLYSTLQTGMWIWIVLLLLISLKEMNNYTLKQTILIAFLSLFTMVVICATSVLLFSIVSQFLDFVQEVLVEIRYKFY